jgi:NADPH-dependent glutamate synthase beta subunit-like oxidoreductase
MPVTETEYNEAVEEGIKMNFLVNPTRIVSDGGKVTGLDCVRMELGDIDASGRPRPVPVKGSEFFIAADAVIAAVGQSADLSFLPQDFAFQRTKAERLAVDNFTLSTNMPGVFAGGDFVTGPAMVIDAIAAGRRAALAIDHYISGSAGRIILHDMRSELAPTTGEKAPPEVQEKQAQQKMPELAVKKRRNCFKEIELGYSRTQDETEAKRCLRCDLEER